MNLKLLFPVCMLAVVVPMSVAVVSNWENLQPYLVSEPQSAGVLYFFSDRKG